MGECQVSILSVPPEVTERILVFSRYREVAHFTQTCRQFRALVYRGDLYLWRELFLAYPFDDPRQSTAYLEYQVPLEIDWRGDLQRRVRAEHVIASGQTNERLDDAFEALITAIDNSLPESIPGHSVSHNIAWASSVLSNAHFLYSAELTGEQVALRSRIRAYLSLYHEDGASDESSARLKSLRIEARCYVYDLRNYTQATQWGPFTSGKGGLEINWEHVEKIIHVIVMNIRDMAPTWQKLCPEVGLEMTRAYSAPRIPDQKPDDWAGVEGVWRRYISFMDYSELFAFNFSNSRSHCHPSFFEDDDVEEAVRILEMRLRIVECEMPPYPTDDPRFPMIQLEGTAIGTNAAHAHVDGYVRRYKHGMIRWHFVTHYDGQPQWSAEGVQLGNICSAAGVAGIWSGAEHAAGDPAGPFLMWKVADPKVIGLVG